MPERSPGVTLRGLWREPSQRPLLLSAVVAGCCVAFLVASMGLALAAKVEGHGLLGGVVQGPEHGLVLQAVDVPSKSSGIAIRSDSGSPGTSIWYLSSDGTLSFDALFTQPGTFLVTVDAAGAPVDGVGPILVLRLDGQDVGEREVGTQWAPYNWTIRAGAGIHRVEVAYVNDAYSATEDRNCQIATIAIRPLTAAAAPTLPLDDPFWKALSARPKPAWFGAAKFGIFVHWGVYSVPAFAPPGKPAEWYWFMLKAGVPAVVQHQRQTYGAGATYQDLARRFTASRFEPAQWARLFRRSGARYVILTARHHDGFCLWPAPASHGWNSVDAGPRQDLTGELAGAVRSAGLKFGVYYSLGEWFSAELSRDPAAYARDVIAPQLRSLVSRYKPSVLWADGPWRVEGTGGKMTFRPNWSQTLDSESLLGWTLRNDPGVIVNDRWGADVVGRGGDFLTVESYSYDGVPLHGRLWEADRQIGTSWGHKKGDTYQPAATYIRYLIDTASRGGNLLLNVGPTAEGTIPLAAQRILLDMGAWLKANGASIYGTTAGPIQNTGWYPNTQKPGRLFIFLTSWPKSGKVTVSLPDSFIAGAKLLSSGQSLTLKTHSAAAHTAVITLPGTRPGDIVPVVEVSTLKSFQPSAP